MNLGDCIADALSVLGVTPERVERFLGQPCHCKERQEKMNMLGHWARRVLAGKTAHALEYLRTITGDV